MATVAGSVERIIFSDPESGFLVARLLLADAESDRESITTILGTLPSVRPGERLRLTGEWQTHPVHGRNFRVEQFEPQVPESAEGVERYLGSGVIKGIGPVTASRIVEVFGSGALTVLEEDPDQLKSIPGISAKRLQTIKESWDERKKIRSLLMFLQEHGISAALAGRVHERYGDQAVDVIQANPYQLAHNVQGIGFRTADAVAEHLGMSKQSLPRYVAGLKYSLSEATDSGHVFLPKRDLLLKAAALLGTGQEQLEPALLELLRLEHAIIDGDDIYLAPFYKAEVGATRLLDRLRQVGSGFSTKDGWGPAEVVRAAAEAQGLQLAPAQIQAAHQALREKVSILTGGPGTGKTSTLRTIITALESAEIQFSLCAPTGRAAKRAAEASGRPASTIHRLLEFQPRLNVFGYDQSNPLPVDFVIVDEVSMLDILLAYHLLKAIRPDAHLLLVGDADQLPAVGPGNVLRDLISSGTIATTTLTQLFRQALGSQIILAAHALNDGRMPEIGNRVGDDLFFVHGEDPDHLLLTIKRLLRERIPEKFSLDPIEDVQIISPMHAGPLGVSNLNVELQAFLNPNPVSRIQRGDRIFCAGDKVMQIRNNYEKDIYNGDIGKVTRIDEDERRVIVAFPSITGQVEIEYEGSALDELVLAYAISVHKAQGSEFPAVIMPVVTRHHMLLQRNLLYTAITRARQLCVLVGSPRALATAAESNPGNRRHTRLASRVTQLSHGVQPDFHLP